MNLRILSIACALLGFSLSGCNLWTQETQLRSFEAQLYARHAAVGPTCAEGCGEEGVCWDGRCVDAQAVVQLDAGDSFTCALRAEGTVWCWGSNADRTLAQPASVAHLSSPTPIEGLTSAVQLESGYAHSCALTRSGAIRCWGLNHAGQLGDGTQRSPQPRPAAVIGVEDAVQVAVGVFHTCALHRSGRVSCWGDGQRGQLGGGAITNSNRPVPVIGVDNAVSIHAGDASSCALLDDGELRCWGAILDLLAPELPPHTPATLSAFEDIAQLELGSQLVCARQYDGDVFCLGDGGEGQLGNGMRDDSDRPVRVVGLRTARDLTLGMIQPSFGCALNEDRSVACWGAGDDGQLGDGTTLRRLHPVEVRGLRGPVAELTTGASHTCARLTTGALQCWGDNQQGQLGDGTTTFHTLPTDVLSF